MCNCVLQIGAEVQHIWTHPIFPVSYFHMFPISNFPFLLKSQISQWAELMWANKSSDAVLVQKVGSHLWHQQKENLSHFKNLNKIEPSHICWNKERELNPKLRFDISCRIERSTAKFHIGIRQGNGRGLFWRGNLLRTKYFHSDYSDLTICYTENIFIQNL